MASNDDDLLWTLASSGAAIVAAAGAKKLLTKGWVKRKGKVPGNPASSDTTWSEALTWAVISGVAVGVVRLVAQRGVALAFQQRRGDLPEAAATKPSA